MTLEIEQIGADALAAVSAIVPLRPPAAAVVIVQDRLRQRQWLDANGFPLGAWRAVSSATEAAPRSRRWAGRAQETGRRLRRTRAGPRRQRPTDAAAAWAVVRLRAGAGRAVPRPRARAVGAGRAPRGRRDGDLRAGDQPPRGRECSTGPSGRRMLPPDVSRQAMRVAEGHRDEHGHRGPDRRRDVPHARWTAAGERARAQAAQLVSPLGARRVDEPVRAVRPRRVRPAVRLGRRARPGAIANLLGDLWGEGEPDFESALTIPDVRLHLYGKTSARPGRKMGHLSAVGDTVEEAREKVLTARSRLAARFDQPTESYPWSCKSY